MLDNLKSLDGVKEIPPNKLAIAKEIASQVHVDSIEKSLHREFAQFLTNILNIYGGSQVEVPLKQQAEVVKEEKKAEESIKTTAVYNEVPIKTSIPLPTEEVKVQTDEEEILEMEGRYK